MGEPNQDINDVPEKSAGDREGREQRNEMNLVELKSKNIRELMSIARGFNIEGASSMRKQELIFALLQAQAQMSGLIYGEIGRAHV